MKLLGSFTTTEKNKTKTTTYVRRVIIRHRNTSRLNRLKIEMSVRHVRSWLLKF